MSTTSSSPTVLTCSHPVQFLASLPLMLGYVPSQSIVVVLFEGRQAKCAARLDLPPAEIPLETTRLDEAVLEITSRLSWVESVAVVVYSDEAFAEGKGAPRALLAMWLERALEMAGVAVRELACVARNGWSLYRSPTSAMGRPLSEIDEHTACFTALLPERAAPAPLSSLGSLPVPDEDLRRTVREAVLMRDEVDISGIDVDHFQALVNDCLEVLRNDTFPPHVEASATVIRATERIDSWLVPVMLIAADSDDDLVTLSKDTAAAFLGVLQDASRTPASGGRSMTERLLMFSSQRLNQARLRRTIATLMSLASLTPAKQRPGVMALAAWAWWMGGMSSPATTLLDEARASEANHPAVTSVSDLLDSGSPLWVFEQTR